MLRFLLVVLPLQSVVVFVLGSAANHESNASDAEVVYWKGKTLVYSAGGDQQMAGDLQWAEFDGTPRELFERFFASRSSELRVV